MMFHFLNAGLVAVTAISLLVTSSTSCFAVAAAAASDEASNDVANAEARINSKKGNNLIFILTDQQRYDAMQFVQEERGWPERSRISTPNLDRIAREGAYFRNAYTHCAVCVPARASLLTGSTIENTGIRTNGLSKDENLPGTDAEYKLPKRRTYDNILVNDHGYVADYFGKWHSPNQLATGVYSNDVRVAAGTKSWFGKYNDEDGSKRYSTGMSTHYRTWLANQTAASIASFPLEVDDQKNTFSTYYYDPDPLDTRYGLPADSGNKYFSVHIIIRSSKYIRIST